MNKVIAIILTICILFIILTACVNDDENTEDKGDAQRDGVTFVNTHFEMYTYEWEQLELPSSVNYVQVALTHEGRIYYAYLEYNTDETSTLIISNIKPNGNDEQRIEVQSFANDIASFNITNDGNFAFLLFNRIITSQGISLSVHYVEYDNNGTELIRRDINEFLLVSNPQPNTFLLLKDGRILFINSDENIIVEFDFDNNSWGDKLLLADETGRVHTLYPVGENTDFDFLLSDGTFLYGYNIEKNEQTLLLSWIVTGFANVDNAKVGIFEDGRVFVITGDNNPIDEKNIELHILTPISREEMPEKIILTMAGLTIMEDARQAITAFNRQNPNYRIEIYEYVNQSDFKVGPDGFITNADEVWDQAMLRFQVDIVTGNIPDFIFQPPKEMYNQNLLLDLYPFIDADPEINREDFLPNVLAAMESSNGKLYSFGNQFAINAIVSRHELLGHIEKWTPAEIYRIINDTQDMQFPFGTVMLRELFIRMMLFTANMGFIDWNNYLAHFDTDEFIDLLYTSMLLPSLSDIPPGIYQGDTVHEIIKMQRGEQLLKWGTFWGPSLYQLFADSFDDMIILGLPNVNGGIYTINASGGIGIGASTEHPDITWEFLRSLLLKTSNDFALNTYSNPYFPVRIDLFDELIEDIMKPRTRTGAGGERVEYPREVWLAQDDSGYSIELYAMSQEKADNLRIFVKSAIPTHRGIDNELWVIIQSDLEQFYAGTRSAEDTARIIQSRAQIWLSELELIYEN